MVYSQNVYKLLLATFVTTIIFSCNTSSIVNTTHSPLNSNVINYKDLNKFNVKTGAIGIPCSERWYIRVFNVDDSGSATVNLNDITTVGYNGDSGYIDVTDYLNDASNSITFKMFNYYGGYTWGFEIKRDNQIIFREVAGQAGVSGANGGDTTATNQYVYDKTININVCQNNQNNQNEFCETLYDSDGNSSQNCVSCKDNEDLVFTGGHPTCVIRGQNVYTTQGFNLKYTPYGQDGINQAVLFKGECNE